MEKKLTENMKWFDEEEFREAYFSLGSPESRKGMKDSEIIAAALVGSIDLLRVDLVRSIKALIESVDKLNK